MSDRAVARACRLVLALIWIAVPAVALAQEGDKGALKHEGVVAGSPKDFMEVRRLVLKGSNQEIGKALATIAREKHQLKPMPATDRYRSGVQRRFIEKHDPILFDRMRGVAAAFGRRIDDEAFNFGGLWYFQGLRAGCSVVYYPPGLTASGRSVVSRNYDFTTGTLMGERPPPGELPCTARPYVIEMHPDKGYASLAICSYDLLSGVMDGINSEGLTVALLADDELMAKFPMEPAGSDAVGLGVVQMLRMLLDCCATADEAKELLLMTKQYYEIVPVHYLVADRHGKSFVFEHSQTRNREHVIENPGKPLVTTNFSLHRHLDGKTPPSAQKSKEICPRYCRIAERLAGESGKLTAEIIKETHKTADLVEPSPSGTKRPPHRTLWHALYFPEERKMQVSFYLRDEAPADAAGKSRIVRTPYLDFALKTSGAGK